MMLCWRELSARFRPMSTVGRFERSTPPTLSPEALSRNSHRVAVCRNNVRVMAANVREVGILVEVAHRVATHKRKSMRVGQLIPEHFKAKCRVPLTCLPQDVHHLTVDSDRAIGSTSTRSRDYVAHGLVELPSVGFAVRHERGEGVLGIEQNQIIRSHELRDIQGSC